MYVLGYFAFRFRPNNILKYTKKKQLGRVGWTIRSNFKKLFNKNIIFAGAEKANCIIFSRKDECWESEGHHMQRDGHRQHWYRITFVLSTISHVCGWVPDLCKETLNHLSIVLYTCIRMHAHTRAPRLHTYTQVSVWLARATVHMEGVVLLLQDKVLAFPWGRLLIR